MRAFRNVLMAAGIALAAWSCTPSTTIPCADDGDCPSTGDLLRACNTDLGVCQEVECLKSTDCGMFEYCNDAGSCIPGCESDDDCLAGESCDTETNACQAYGCRTTALDCEYGETCDQATGQCTADPAPHCARCTEDWYSYTCPGNAAGECAYFDDDTTRLYCLVSCIPSADDACPRGYDCVDAFGDGRTFCVGSCPIYEELGYVQ